MNGNRMLMTVAVGVAVLAGVRATARADDPIVVLDLPTTGQQDSFGAWLQSALADEPLDVRWLELAPKGVEEQPAAVVTWSMTDSPGDRTRQLRDLVRNGGGLVYVVGAGETHVRRARAFWGPLDVNIEVAGGGSGYGRWVQHPLTEGAGEIGAVTPDCAISGVGGSPLAEVGGRAVAMAFDWGPLGRAVIIDQALLFDQLNQDNPRPALREVLVRAVRWAAGEAEAPSAPAAVNPLATSGPVWGSLPEPGPVGPPAKMTALLDVPDDRDDWSAIKSVLVNALREAGLTIDEPPVVPGEPVITPERLEQAGLLVVGSGREEVAFSETLAVQRFFEGGGRLLFLGHAEEKSQKRMIGFNQLMTGLPVAASLDRHSGFAELLDHPITRGLSVPDDVRIRRGMQIWAPLALTLVQVDGRAAAAAWQVGSGRVVVMDGELLRAPEKQREPLTGMVALLRNALGWLLGDL